MGRSAYYVGGVNGMPYKPRAAATAFVLARQGWTNREVVLIGNSDIDMKTASTGQLMFLNATWHGIANPYGFQFASPLDIARFVDCVCLGLNTARSSRTPPKSTSQTYMSAISSGHGLLAYRGEADFQSIETETKTRVTRILHCCHRPVTVPPCLLQVR